MPNLDIKFKGPNYTTTVARTNYLASGLSTFIGKTLVPNSNVLFAYLFINKKLYYNSGLSLNRNIDFISTSL